MTRLLQGIRAQVALALLLIVGGALAVAYAIVVPSLENRLVEARLDLLESNGIPLLQTFPLEQSFLWQDYAETVAPAANARVVVYDVLSRRPPAISVHADSRTVSSQDVASDLVAELAAVSGKQQRETVTREERRYAEVAVPLTAEGPIVVFSASLDDVLSTVRLVERRLLLAGLIAVLVVLAAGLAAANVHANRIRRLERAAERIAGGRFDEPVVDRGSGELGELAGAFERMRVRLARLDRARQEFIANASHELRTPIFSLGGFIELMVDEELDEETRREFLVTMREQVARLTKLATDLLDLSRLDAGNLLVEREPIELAPLARELVDAFAPLGELGEHRLDVRADGDLDALGDADRVLQIGRILVENALRHTPPGTRVVVRARREGGRALLSVEDDGPGIAAEHAGHVFERFYRVEGDRASGSGLGLAIARELASLMDGRLTLESQPGRTVFTLELAAVDAPAREPAAA